MKRWMNEQWMIGFLYAGITSTVLPFAGCIDEGEALDADDPDGGLLPVGVAEASLDLGDALFAGESMELGDYLKSPNGKFRAVLQSEGNLVVYQTAPTWKALWSSPTWDDPVNGMKLTTSGDLRIFGDGVYHSYSYSDQQTAYNFTDYQQFRCVDYNHWLEYPGGSRVPYGSGSQCATIGPYSSYTFWYTVDVYRWTDQYTYWRTQTSASTNQSALRMQDDGNLVLYNTSNDAVLWETGTREQVLNVWIEGPTVVWGAQQGSWIVKSSGALGPMSYHWNVKQVDTGFVLLDGNGGAELSRTLPDTVPGDEAWIITLVATDGYYTRTYIKWAISVY